MLYVSAMSGKVAVTELCRRSQEKKLCFFECNEIVGNGGVWGGVHILDVIFGEAVE